MTHHKKKQAANTTYKSPTTMHSCILCGRDNISVHFKGKCVCEDCLDFVKDLY